MFENNNYQNRINVNTTFITWYSSESKLILGGWNDKITIDFIPCTGKDANGLNVYDRDRKLGTALSHENSETLYQQIKERIVPHIINGDDTEINVAVMTKGKDSMNLITVGRKKIDGEMKMQVVFYKNVGGDGKATEATQIMTHTFAETEYMENYDPNTGSGTQGKECSQFRVFAEIIKNHAKLIPMETHSGRYSKAILDSVSARYNNNGPTKPTGSTPGDFMSGIEELPFS